MQWVASNTHCMAPDAVGCIPQTARRELDHRGIRSMGGLDLLGGTDTPFWGLPECGGALLLLLFTEENAHRVEAIC